jgi:hypothetical protein
MHASHTVLCIVLAVAFMWFGLHTCYQCNRRKEGFAPLSPGSFPDASTYPLLHKDYPIKTPGGFSDLSSSDLWTYYPVFDHGYAQYTNNVRYWATPNNGKCSPAGFCGGLYADKPIEKMRIVPVPKPISLKSDVRRVNFYGSDPMTCPGVPSPEVANCLHFGRKTDSLTPPYLLDS